jgi:AcrR family transcriptional regulator
MSKTIDKRRSPETKELILNAAEKLLSERGYYGTSLRDITRLSGVQVSLSYYHFGSKEDVLMAVVDRRADEHVEHFRRSLEHARESSQGKPLAVDALIEAFARPALERLVQGDSGWKCYVQLLAHLAFESARSDYAKPFFRFDDLVAEFIEELKQILPGANYKDLHWAFYFLQSATTNALLQTGMIDRQSKNLCDSSNIEEIIQEIKSFFSAGLAAFQQRKP